MYIPNDLNFHWRGWYASPSTLRQAGWDVVSDQDFHRDAMVFKCTLPQEWRVKYTDEYNYSRYIPNPDEPFCSSLPFEREFLDKVAFTCRINRYDPVYMQSVDLEELITRRRGPVVKQPKLILPKEESVNELLQRIVALQQEERIKNIRESIQRDASLITNSENILLFDRS